MQSVQDTGLVGGHHVLDVDEGVFSSVHLKQLEGLLDQVTEVVALALAVVDLVAHVQVFGFEKIHDGENLSVVWHESLADGVGAGDEGLQDLQGDGYDFWVSGVEGGLDGDDQLGDDRQHLGASLVEHVEHALDGQESVGVDLLANALEENGEVVVVVQLLYVHFPVDFILRAVLDGHWQVASVVEQAELADGDGSGVHSASSWLLRNGLLLGPVQAGGLAAESVALLEDGSARGGDGHLLLVDRLDGCYACCLSLHVLRGEVSEGRVLGARQVGVVVWLPGLRRRLMALSSSPEIGCSVESPPFKRFIQTLESFRLISDFFRAMASLTRRPCRYIIKSKR